MLPTYLHIVVHNILFSTFSPLCCHHLCPVPFFITTLFCLPARIVAVYYFALALTLSWCVHLSIHYVLFALLTFNTKEFRQKIENFHQHLNLCTLFIIINYNLYLPSSYLNTREFMIFLDFVLHFVG